MRRLLFALLVPLCLVPLHGATLVQLSLTEMIANSTAIVRGKVQSSYAASSGPLIWTHYQVQITEQLKGTGTATVDVAVFGGVANGIVQNYSGAPQFQPGEEYVFFLYHNQSGRNLILGFTQGLFAVASDSASNPSLTHTASPELMLDRSTHQPVKDRTLTMRLSDLRSQIAAAQGAAQ